MCSECDDETEEEYLNNLSMQSMVEEFHHKTGAAIDKRTPYIMRVRRALLREEYRELRDELVEAATSLALGHPIPNLGKIAKEASDLIYVVLGLCTALGIDGEEAFRRVHQSNMSKLVDGVASFSPEGKVLKGPNYVEPDMTGTYREEDDG
jgi:predicted HAD superfamily Cof-like phosphohydrolase